MFEWFFNINRALSRSFTLKYNNIVYSEKYIDKMLLILRDLIGNKKVPHVLEVGGIDRPLLSKSDKYFYDGLDIEYKDICDEIYDEFFVQSIENPVTKEYDIICSLTLLEHVKNNTRSFNSMFNALKTDGIMVHYVPNKYHPYSLIARIIGSKLSSWLLYKLHPKNVGIVGYPSFYDKCSIRVMRELSMKSGFKKVTIIPFYRANSYFEVLFPVFFIVTLFENICNKFTWSLFCSGFILVAEK